MQWRKRYSENFIGKKYKCFNELQHRDEPIKGKKERVKRKEKGKEHNKESETLQNFIGKKQKCFKELEHRQRDIKH